MLRKTGFLLLFVFFALCSQAQYFQTGQDPASIRWRQINTQNFRLIYPSTYQRQAQRMAAILEKVYGYDSYSLKYKPRKIPVILHTRTVQSNGLVAWAPSRVEMYTTPNQSIYPQDWLHQLAIHELRHVVQIDKVSRNLPEIVKIVLGQQGTALVTGAYLPLWFLEGDAVVTETALSNFGRGRFPSFLMETQAQVTGKGIYPLSKAYLGSYRDFVPDYYKLGYYLVGGVRNLYGPDVWEKVVSNVGKRPLSLTPFNTALKKFTGYNQNHLYKTVFDSLRSGWKKDDKYYTDSLVNIITRRSGVYSNYRYNFIIGNDSVLTYRSALNSVPRFVIVAPDGKEKRVQTPGTIFDESVGLTGHLLTWSEQVPDLRWEHSGRSLIHVFNLQKKTEMKLKPEFKGFSPAVSPDNKMIAMVETDSRNNYYLSVYSLNTGKLVTRYQTPANNYLFTPRWYGTHQLVVVVLDDNGKFLALIDPFENKIENITDESLGDIEQPSVKGQEVYFISSYSGRNDLYVLSLEDRKVYRVFRSRFGVAYPAVTPANNDIVLSDYTPDGYRLIRIRDVRNNREPLSSIQKGSYPLAQKLASQEKGVISFADLDTTGFTWRKYSKAGHLFRFHSWEPVYFDVNSFDIEPGVNILSQNSLGTAVTSVGYRWDASEKTGRLIGKFTYQGWYPEINLEMTSGNRATEYNSITNYLNQQHEIVLSDTSRIRTTWSEKTLNVGADLPLNLTRGKFYRLLQPEVKFGLTSRTNVNLPPGHFANGIINIATYHLYYHQILKQSYQDLVPDFGIVADIIYRNSPGGNLNLGNLTCFQFITYLPGFLRNHGLEVYNGYQIRHEDDGYTFTDIIKYPRGWGNAMSNRMYSFSADYKFPLFYPDWSIGKLVYLKRLKASLYADYAYQEGNNYQQGLLVGQFTDSFSSYGIELTGDMNFLRIPAPVDTGIRIGYLPEIGQMDFGFLFSVDFTSF